MVLHEICNMCDLFQVYMVYGNFEHVMIGLCFFQKWPIYMSVKYCIQKTLQHTQCTLYAHLKPFAPADAVHGFLTVLDPIVQSLTTFMPLKLAQPWFDHFQYFTPYLVITICLAKQWQLGGAGTKLLCDLWECKYNIRWNTCISFTGRQEYDDMR